MTSVYLQVLTQLESLGAEVTETTVLNIMRAYEASGESSSIREVFSRFNSTGSAASTVAVFNKVLSAYVSTPELTSWESIVNHFDQYYGPNHILADATTYDSMMIACEKYNRADESLVWFDESVRSSATNTVTKVQRESLIRMIGDEKYKEYMGKLSVEHLAKVMSVASSNLKTASSSSSSSSLSSSAVAGAPAATPVSVPLPKLKGNVDVTSSSVGNDSLPKSKKTLNVAGSLVTTKKEESKAKSESKVSKVVVPSSSSSKVVSDSASKKVWVPSSSSSKVASDGAAGRVQASSISAAKIGLSRNCIRNRILKAAASKSDNSYEVVQEIKAAMKAANVEPTVDIMNAMMSAYTQIGDVVATQRMIDEMKLAGLEPNPISISFLVSVYLRNSDKAGAERAWTEALTGGMKPGMTYLLL
jgi:pentatricopeptide repeat protein